MIPSPGPLRSAQMMIRYVLLLTVAFPLATCCCGAADAAQKTNVVYIMADELGYYELSCLGNPNIQTPRIDAMAAEGIRFTQALAGSSVCAPTRCCLMTGKHSGHTSVRSNGGGTPLRAGEATIASMLKTQGYATGGFGKWGCGGRGFNRRSRRSWLRRLLRLLRPSSRPHVLSALLGSQQRRGPVGRQPRDERRQKPIRTI